MLLVQNPQTLELQCCVAHAGSLSDEANSCTFESWKCQMCNVNFPDVRVDHQSGILFSTTAVSHMRRCHQDPPTQQTIRRRCNLVQWLRKWTPAMAFKCCPIGQSQRRHTRSTQSKTRSATQQTKARQASHRVFLLPARTSVLREWQRDNHIRGIQLLSTATDTTIAPTSVALAIVNTHNEWRITVPAWNDGVTKTSKAQETWWWTHTVGPRCGTLPLPKQFDTLPRELTLSVWPLQTRPCRECAQTRRARRILQRIRTGAQTWLAQTRRGCQRRQRLLAKCIQLWKISRPVARRQPHHWALHWLQLTRRREQVRRDVRIRMSKEFAGCILMFDRNVAQYGPASGITRLDRWKRKHDNVRLQTQALTEQPLLERALRWAHAYHPTNQCPLDDTREGMPLARLVAEGDGEYRPETEVFFQPWFADVLTWNKDNIHTESFSLTPNQDQDWFDLTDFDQKMKRRLSLDSNTKKSRPVHPTHRAAPPPKRAKRVARHIGGDEIGNLFGEFF